MFTNSFIEKGRGPALILLHGNGEDGSYFSHQMEAFSDRYRVIAVDTRGHGRTPRGEAPFTIRQFADDLLAFMDAQGLAKADILGFSDGGNIALVFALAHPERVGRLILNGANLDPSGVRPGVQLPVEIGYRVARFFSRWSQKALARAELLGLMVNDPAIAPEQLETLSMPVLVIAGDDDMIRDSHTRMIASRIPGAKLAIIEGDHFIAARRPEAFNAVVAAFLDGCAE